MVISLLFTRGIAFPVPQFREKTTKANGVALEEEHFHQLLPDLMLNRKQTVRTGRIWMLLHWCRKLNQSLHPVFGMRLTYRGLAGAPPRPLRIMFGLKDSKHMSLKHAKQLKAAGFTIADELIRQQWKGRQDLSGLQTKRPSAFFKRIAFEIHCEDKNPQIHTRPGTKSPNNVNALRLRLLVLFSLDV